MWCYHNSHAWHWVVSCLPKCDVSGFSLSQLPISGFLWRVCLPGRHSRLHLVFFYRLKISDYWIAVHFGQLFSERIAHVRWIKGSASLFIITRWPRVSLRDDHVPAHLLYFPIRKLTYQSSRPTPPAYNQIITYLVNGCEGMQQTHLFLSLVALLSWNFPRLRK